MSTLLRFTVLTATFFQWSIGYWILRRRPLGPFALVASVMFFLNGFAASVLALAGTPADDTLRWFQLADGATGPLIFAVGLLLLRHPRHDRWDTLSTVVVAGGMLWALGLVAAGAPTELYHSFLLPRWNAIHSLPGYVGLGLAGFAMARAVGRDDGATLRDAGLLGFAYLTSLTVNVSVNATIGLAGMLLQPITRLVEPRTAGIIVAIALAHASLVILLWPRAGNATWRHRLLFGAVAGAVLAFANYATADRSNELDYALYVLFTASIYFIRPICLGLVLVGERTFWALYDTAVVAALVMLAKSVSFLLGTPFDTLSAVDLAGAGVALLLAPLAFLLPRRLVRRDAGPAADRPADHVLASFLLARFSPEAGAGFVTKQEIEAATGIKENNLAAAVRRLERRLGPEDAPGTLVTTRLIGVRGRKEYRLTPEGARRAAGLFGRP